MEAKCLETTMFIFINLIFFYYLPTCRNYQLVTDRYQMVFS